MRINIISSHRANTGLNQDSLILRGALAAAYGENVAIRRVYYMLPECPEAEMNIFLEVVNPSLFSYARQNIWIPNPEWTYRTWIPYIEMFDQIWCKTQECKKIFDKYSPSKTRYIGWTSISKGWAPETDRKDYYKALVPVGKNIFRNPKPILQAYFRLLSNKKLYNKLPTLHIVYEPSVINFHVPDEIKSKVVLHAEVMKDKEYDELVRDCGLCICVSACEGFGHAVREAMSVGCNLIISPIDPFLEDVVGSNKQGVFYTQPMETIEQTECIGTMVDTDVSTIMLALEEFTETDFRARRNNSQFLHELFNQYHEEWKNQFISYLKSLTDNLPEYSLKDIMPKESELPDVSIVTITKDRRVFMPLAKYSYMIQSYPEDKLEWVIVDDGDDPIEDTLIGVPNVKYVRCEKMSISDKRNLGVQNAMYDIICMMDDDDVYPNNSVLQRVAMLLKEPAKQCAFCTTIPCYDITKYSSFMNVPPITLSMCDRISEASLVFTKKFWEERKFGEGIQIAEAGTFIRDREQMCREVSPQEVIVSLIHSLNTSSRKTPEMKEPNGCHYGFNEKLFALVSQIGEDLKTKELA